MGQSKTLRSFYLFLVWKQTAKTRDKRGWGETGGGGVVGVWLVGQDGVGDFRFTPHQKVPPTARGK
jgi:hypothetical protein